MSRLIDADKIKQEIAIMNVYGTSGMVTTCALMKLIDRQPTVFDVDKVVEQIHKKSLKMSTTKLPHTYMRAIGTREVEKIVRSGGVDE